MADSLGMKRSLSGALAATLGIAAIPVANCGRPTPILVVWEVYSSGSDADQGVGFEEPM
jgi:hypothetical protein